MRFLIPILLFATTCFGADYYIDPAGNDGHDGLTPQTAWQTLGRAQRTTLEPGDRVLLAEGHHRGPLVLRQSGTADKPITITRAAPTGIAIIQGGEYGIDASVSHVRIVDVRIVGSTNKERGGIMIWADRDLEDIEINNCRIQRHAGRGIWIAGDPGKQVRNVRIVENLIENNAGSGIQIAKFAGGTISGNLIRNNCQQPVEEWQAGVRVWSPDVNNLQIAQNRIENGVTEADKANGMGIHVDEVGEKVVVKDNTIFDCDSAGIEVENTRGVHVANNIIQNAHTGIFVYRAGHDHLIERNTVVGRALGIVLQGHRANGVNAGPEIEVDGKLFTGNKVVANVAMAGRWASLKINGGAELGATEILGNHFGDGRPSLFQWGDAEFGSLAAFEKVVGDTKACHSELRYETIGLRQIPIMREWLDQDAKDKKEPPKP